MANGSLNGNSQRKQIGLDVAIDKICDEVLNELSRSPDKNKVLIHDSGGKGNLFRRALIKRIGNLDRPIEIYVDDRVDEGRLKEEVQNGTYSVGLVETLAYCGYEGRDFRYYFHLMSSVVGDWCYGR